MFIPPPSLGASSVAARAPADFTSFRRGLQPGAKTGLEVSAESPTDVDTVIYMWLSLTCLKICFSKQFRAELESVGGSSQSLAAKSLYFHITTTALVTILAVPCQGEDWLRAWLSHWQMTTWLLIATFVTKLVLIMQSDLYYTVWWCDFLPLFMQFSSSILSDPFLDI